tara:strand:+ start:253 stop:546 length:294 start_codon:yes stop_codon:yes gene_type:complete
MKSIQPISIWVNGQNKTANFINVSIIGDNLKDNATFYYELLEQPHPEGDEQITHMSEVFATGNVALVGDDYTNWGTSTDVNQDAYNIVASKLGLTLI